MRCLECQTENEQSATSCRECGASLQPALAQMYLEQADAAIAQGEYDTATANIAAADRVIMASNKEQRSKHPLNAYAFFLQAQMLYQQGRVAQARTEALLAEQALAAYPETGKWLLVRVYRLIGITYYYEGSMDEAIPYYNHAVALGEELGNYEIAAVATSNLGNISVMRGNIEIAANYYQRALEYAARDGRPSSFARIYRLFAWLHSNYGPYPLGLEYADKCLALHNQIDNLDTRSLVVNEAVGVYLKAGMISAAEPYILDLYNHAQRSGSKLLEERVMPYIVWLICERGDRATWFPRVARFFSDPDTSAMYKSDLALQMGRYYIAQSDELRIRRFLKQLLDRHVASPLSEGVAVLHQTLGLLYAALGQWAEAEDEFKQALGEQIPTYDHALIWQDYGSMLLHRAKQEASPTILATAQNALAQAAQLYRELQVDYRLNQVTHMLASIVI